jgi:tetratricopeptide (TPR) repeat protein
MTLAVLTAAGAVALGAASYFNGRLGQARAALRDGQAQMADGQWEGAVRALRRGQSAARGLLGHAELGAELDRQLRRAEQGQAAARRAAVARALNQLADRVRSLYGAEPLAPEGLRALESPCRALWQKRGDVVEQLRPGAGVVLDATARDDLLDLAIFWADLQVRLAPPGAEERGRQEALAILAQAEILFGPSPVLELERRLHGAAARAPSPQARTTPETAWEHYALGRALLRSGDLPGAAAELTRAVRLQPQGLWPNFYQGLCAYRLGRYPQAVPAYSVCIGAALGPAEGTSPAAARCFYNRALAFAALHQTEEALRDYDQALQLDPDLASAAIPREQLRERARR